MGGIGFGRGGVVMVGEKNAGEPRTQPRQNGRVPGGSIILSKIIPRKHARRGFVLFFGSFSSSLNVTSTAFDEAMVSATGVH